MTTTLTANQLSGRATGSLFFNGFGALWLVLGLYASQRLDAAAAAVLLVCFSLLLFAGVQLIKESKRWPHIPNDPAVGRAFGWINLVQWVAVFVVAFTLAKLNLSVYVMNAITLIVGLHMFPLARVFRYPMHNATGSALVAWAILSAFIVPTNQLQGIAALGTGIILWMAAGITIRRAFNDARKSVPPQATNMSVSSAI